MKNSLALALLLYVPLATGQRIPHPHSKATTAVTTTPTMLLGVETRYPGVFTDRQMNDSSVFSVNGLDTDTEFQSTQGNAHATEALVGGVITPPESTVHQTQGVSGYVVNRSSAGENGSAAVGVYGQSRCDAGVDGDRCWGANFVSAARTDEGANTSAASTLYGIEVDVAPGNAADGADGVMSLLNANLSDYTANAAFLAGGNTIKNNNKWIFGLETMDGGAKVAVGAGATCTFGTCASQPLRFYYYSGDQESYATLYADSSGSLVTPSIAPKGGIKFQGRSVAALPACSTSNEGQAYWVTDASSPTPNGTLNGGGTTGTLAICNGSTWTAH